MFWELTPAEFSECVKAYNKKKESESEQIIVQAYLTAYWQRVKKMPSLKEVLHKPQKKQSTEQMLATVKHLNAMFGGEVNGGS